MSTKNAILRHIFSLWEKIKVMILRSTCSIFIREAIGGEWRNNKGTIEEGRREVSYFVIRAEEG